MSDLISRDAVIQALYDGAYLSLEKRHALVDRIDRIPTVEPEVIRCKDCKHFEYDKPYVIQGLPVLGHEVCDAWGDGCKTDENGYCFLAERRTDG